MRLRKTVRENEKKRKEKKNKAKRSSKDSFRFGKMVKNKNRFFRDFKRVTQIVNFVFLPGGKGGNGKNHQRTSTFYRKAKRSPGQNTSVNSSLYIARSLAAYIPILFRNYEMNPAYIEMKSVHHTFTFCILTFIKL